MPDDRKIREGALQPDRDPKAQPPGPKGSTPLNPITGRPAKDTTPKDALPQVSPPKGTDRN
jgi:hypothetical protein